MLLWRKGATLISGNVVHVVRVHRGRDRDGIVLVGFRLLLKCAGQIDPLWFAPIDRLTLLLRVLLGENVIFACI